MNLIENGLVFSEGVLVVGHTQSVRLRFLESPGTFYVDKFEIRCIHVFCMSDIRVIHVSML
jgi:hypothetical protein